jgi:hypothetical protein
MKSDKATVRKRVEEIMQLRLMGAMPTDIRRHAEDQGWAVSERQLQRYTAEADELLARAVEGNRDRLMAHHFAARRALFARAISVRDYATAARVLKDEAELLGLYPPKKSELSGPNGGPIPTTAVEMTDDERATAIAALNGRLARLGAAAPRPVADQPSDGDGPALGSTGTADDGDRDDTGPLAAEVTPFLR